MLRRRLFDIGVTKDPSALESARKSVEAMLRLESITGRSGFPARSFRHKGEPRHNDGIWHFTSDGEWEWKADTSSDEIVGHFFAYSVVYDLAADESLKNRLRGAVVADGRPFDRSRSQFDRSTRRTYAMGSIR